MEKLSSIFWFLSLPVFIYVCYRVCLLALSGFEKMNHPAGTDKKDKSEH